MNANVSVRSLGANLRGPRNVRLPVYRRDGADPIEYTVKNTSLTCDILFDCLDVFVAGDAIHVKYKIGYGSEYGE